MAQRVIQGVYTAVEAKYRGRSLEPLRGSSPAVWPVFSESERAYERAVYGGARSRPNILVFCTCGRDAICPSKRCSSHCVELC